jgi:hypothetical protein
MKTIITITSKCGAEGCCATAHSPPCGAPVSTCDARPRIFAGPNATRNQLLLGMRTSHQPGGQTRVPQGTASSHQKTPRRPRPRCCTAPAARRAGRSRRRPRPRRAAPRGRGRAGMSRVWCRRPPAAPGAWGWGAHGWLFACSLSGNDFLLVLSVSSLQTVARGRKGLKPLASRKPMMQRLGHKRCRKARGGEAAGGGNMGLGVEGGQGSLLACCEGRTGRAWAGGHARAASGRLQDDLRATCG